MKRYKKHKNNPSVQLKVFIDLLKKKIIEAGISEVKIESNELIYSLKKKTNINVSSYDQRVLGELGRAYAILHLIREFKISPNNIAREEPADVGSPSKRLDIKVEIEDVYNDRKCIALAECKISI